MCVTPDQLARISHEVAKEVLGSLHREPWQEQFLADFSARIMARVQTAHGCTLIKGVTDVV